MPHRSDSFTVTVSDGKTNLLSLFGQPHNVTTNVGLSVLSPQAQRVIVNLPSGFTNAQIPRFAADGQSLLFSATPPGAAAGARREIYHVNVDGTRLTCVTCGVADPTPGAAPRDLFKPVPFEDGSGRILMQSTGPGGAYTRRCRERRHRNAARSSAHAAGRKPGVSSPTRSVR